MRDFTDYAEARAFARLHKDFANAEEYARYFNLSGL